MLKQRLITGFLLAGVALAAIIWLPAMWLVGLLALIVLAACWEWADLSGLQTHWARSLYCALSIGASVALVGLTGLATTTPDYQVIRWVLVIAAVWWLLALLLVKAFPASGAWWGSVPLRLAMGWLALLPAWLACVYLRLQADGEWKILFLLTLVAAADIGAYFSGSNFGRHKLAPAVSPGKSWEGFWGGLAAGLLFTVVVHFVFWQQLPLSAFLVIAAATVLASVLGDLVESMVKRFRGVKDSSNLLPGHGGVMDRLDSISAAAPVFALGLLLAA